MVFTQQQKIRRTAYLRIGFVLLFVAIASSLLHFHFAHGDLSHLCGETCLETNYEDVAVPANYIALTFDDGPTLRHTANILDTLKEHQVPATFFVVGRKVMRHPDLVARISREGHEIGNHTFTHKRSVHANKETILWELGETNRLVESITGRSTVMYRPPYLLDLETYEVIPPKDSKPVWGWVYDAGYLPVGYDIDSDDWKAGTSKNAQERVIEMLVELENNDTDIAQRVLLFHDTRHTAQTLSETITLLEENGYRIVPLSTLLGLSQDTVMPPVSSSLASMSVRGLVHGLGILFPILTVLVGIVTLVSAARFFGFIWFKVRRRKRKTITSAVRLMPRFAGKVSVLVPAWNESKNIRGTIQSILANSRQPDEIIIIDDGSSDDTLLHAYEAKVEYPEFIKVVAQRENRGKAAALNAGIAQATGDILIAIDSDTALHPECIDAIARQFCNPKVGAVAGKIVPANTKTLLEKYQYLEYLIGQNMDKQIISSVGAVNIVPGAIGAWRKEIVVGLGGYSEDTLVEDQDLTLAVLGEGYTVVYTPEAVAYTEVPATLRSFYTQRFRWTYGTFQCVWKYRQYLMEPRHLLLGWVALPYALVFNVLLPVVSLLLLSVIAVSIFLEIYTPALLFLLLFTALDIVYGYVALLEEGRSVRWLLIHVPMQRFVYLAIYTVLIFVVSVKVLDGSRTRWTKLIRTGSAQKFFESTLHSFQTQQTEMYPIRTS